MKQVLEAAQQIQNFFDENDWKFCFIGGIALQRWAMPRLTNDADLTLLTGFGSENFLLIKYCKNFNRVLKARRNLPCETAFYCFKLKTSELTFRSARSFLKKMRSTTRQNSDFSNNLFGGGY